MAFILKRVESPSKEEIKKLIAENCTILDKHLGIIGGSLGTRGKVKWDLVGVDKDKRMVLIGVELQYTDKMLYHIVNRVDWAWEHIDNIAGMYPSCGINKDQMPRAIIIAPSYAPSFKKSITYLTCTLHSNNQYTICFSIPVLNSPIIIKRTATKYYLPIGIRS